MTISPNPTEPMIASFACDYGDFLETDEALAGYTDLELGAFMVERGWTQRDRTAQETAEKLVEAQTLPQRILDWDEHEECADWIRDYLAAHPQNQGKEP